KPLEVALGSLAIGDVRPGADDVLRPAFLVGHDREAVLHPDVMTAPVPEAVLDGPAPLGDQPFDLSKDALGILGMDMLGPEGWVIAHLPRQIAHDRRQVLAHEPAGVAVLRLRGRIDDRRTGRDERLQVLHDGHALAQSLLGLLVVGNIRPGADKLQRPATFATDDPEGVLNPDIISGPVAEPILKVATPSLD